MAEGNAVSRAIKWLISRYKSLPAIVVRAILANLLSTGDLASDIYTIESLFALGHDGPAYALLAMVCLSFAGQVRPGLRHLYSSTHAVALCKPHARVGLRRSSWQST
jgi:hypothetical protein